jgi:tRNA A37 N6-isopentenylltransferase MiaA
MMKDRLVIFVLGTTAVGKTKLSLKVAGLTGG